MIDFQWCGWGLGATDLAYFIASNATIDSVDNGGEKELSLLQLYHSTLKTAAGDHCKITMDELQEQYANSLIDIGRIAFSYHWVRSPGASPKRFDANRRAMLAPCSYNKDVKIARWLVTRVDQLLNKVEI